MNGYDRTGESSLDNKMGKKVKNLAVVIAFFILWGLWAMWECVLLRQSQNMLVAALLDVILAKAIIWLLIPLSFSMLYREELAVKLSDLFQERFPWLAAVVMICISAAFLHTVRLLNGLQNTYFVFDAMFLIFSLSAGVIEEFSFRGIFFNTQVKTVGLLPAALINGSMFTLYHYPDLLLGGSWMQLFSYRALLIFVMGILFCIMFYQWRNLALNMTVHTVWNILSYLFCLA